MHAEWVEVDRETVARIYQAKSEGRRIIAVGTTSVRTLEAIFGNVILKPNCPMARQEAEESRVDQKISGSFLRKRGVRITGFGDWVDIFIYPGYKFKIADAMITNFHLPKSTLLMLVSAFAGKKNIVNAYHLAIKKKYRFYSYGDAMFLS
jgi:S-adenosylmethionine:tRNA ribosyltransferase-isomerase